MGTSEHERRDWASRAFPPETWGFVAFLVATLIGVITGFGIDLFGHAISRAADEDALAEATWLLGIATGLFFFATSLTIVMAARRLLERGRDTAPAS
jgi:hypothetical protein